MPGPAMIGDAVTFGGAGLSGFSLDRILGKASSAVDRYGAAFSSVTGVDVSGAGNFLRPFNVQQQQRPTQGPVSVFRAQPPWLMPSLIAGAILVGALVIGRRRRR